MHRNISLLDCTLRDGGYINDWKWGYQEAKAIIRALVRAGIDVVEVGFLRNVSGYNPDITACNKIEELNRLLPEDVGSTVFSAMAMRSNYDIGKLSPYSGQGIEIIRITAHDYDIAEGMVFAREIGEKGYKVSINPINIMGYSDEGILRIIEEVNQIHPYQFSIVDTFGSMKRRDLDRITALVDHNLDRDIRVALHLHENMSLSCSLSQAFVDMHLNRPVAVDGSLVGMGRTPGNLPVELIADYLNDYAEKNYDIDSLLDAIQEYIAPLKGETEWGYTPAYFLSARFNLHRNYAEYYLRKGTLTSRDIHHILSRIQREKATVFDAEYADRLYAEYMDNRIDDREYRERLREAIRNRKILVMAPGSTIVTCRDEILNYIRENDPLVFTVNFIPAEYPVSYAFFANNRRFEAFANRSCNLIVTSNLAGKQADYYIDYNSVSGAFSQGCNSLIMLLKLLKDLDAGNVVLAGADGYGDNVRNYYSSGYTSYIQCGSRFNRAVAEAIRSLGVKVEYLTPSRYDVEV